MSQPKINSKNLSYSSNLPPFLAKLQAQAAGNPGPDPIIAGQRRSAKKRSGSEEAEDAPLVVDEDGNAVSVELDRDGGVVRKPDEAGAEGDEKQGADEGADKSESGGKAAAGTAGVTLGGRKRKVGKVVGGEAADELEKAVEKMKKSDSGKADPESKKDEEGGGAAKKTKKKAKKIKLSFDEEDG